MKADPRFSDQAVTFWAYVRAISEAHGYSKRGSGVVRDCSIAEMHAALHRLNRPTIKLGTVAAPTEFAQLLRDYFGYRASVLNDRVKADLMTAEQARTLFEEVQTSVGAGERCEIMDRGAVRAVEYQVGGTVVRVPMNKQKDEKRFESYLTGMVNLLVAKELDGRPCDYDPRTIPVFDYKGELYGSFSRRMDGCYPSAAHPVAMWEIKEYYYTTTFGSKISDAVYITSLDGYERLEIQRETDIDIQHVVILDAFDTWWGKGKSYLCRLIDILNMGHVDEVIFGREVVRRLPDLARQWTRMSPDIPMEPVG